MEFNEKLQALRKNRGLTQEELAESIFVSRTAISKWESGRGYPNIDSLKELSSFFSVSIDDLLSGDVLISIAEKENKANITKLCNLLFAIVDIFSFMLIILPLYPKEIDGYVYSVSLLSYSDISVAHLSLYWVLFVSAIIMGIVKFILTQLNVKKGQALVTTCSFIISILTVLVLGLSSEAYAIAMAFVLVVLKGLLMLLQLKR